MRSHYKVQEWGPRKPRTRLPPTPNRRTRGHFPLLLAKFSERAGGGAVSQTTHRQGSAAPCLMKDGPISPSKVTLSPLSATEGSAWLFPSYRGNTIYRDPWRLNLHDRASTRPTALHHCSPLGRPCRVGLFALFCRWVKTLRLINLLEDGETVSEEWNPNFSSLSCVNTMPSWGPGASLVAQLVKNPPAMQETPVWFLGRKDLLEKG